MIKKLEEIMLYRPIGLLPILEKLLLKQTLLCEEFVPNHQFSFGHKHGTIEQIHRLVKKTYNDLEENILL